MAKDPEPQPVETYVLPEQRAVSIKQWPSGDIEICQLADDPRDPCGVAEMQVSILAEHIPAMIKALRDAHATAFPATASNDV